MADCHKLARAMCSMDLAESQWTQELPRLPVPDLWLTVSRYLASLKAVLAPTSRLEDMFEQAGCKQAREEIEHNWRQFGRSDQLVKEFMLNEGPQLQRDLREYANKCQNWATEFWLQDMYLSNAVPLPVNSNPFFLFPRQKFASSSEMLMFATRIIQFSVDFKFRIDQQALRQDFGSGHGKGKALCMETYKNFFHSYRMPHEDMDRLLPQSRRSNHIVVASCNQFYILRLGQEPLDNPFRRDASSQLTESSVFEQLLRIYRVSREQAKRSSADESADAATESRPLHNNKKRRIAKVGLFTSENRKQWARIHKSLSQRAEENTQSLRQIEDCLFVMCLDSIVESDSALSNGAASLPVGDVSAARIVATGGGSRLFSANRWFDKFLQIIVGRDGVCGINIEHSASEGITVLRFLEEFLQFVRTNPLDDSLKRLTAAGCNLECEPSKQKFAYAKQRPQRSQRPQPTPAAKPHGVECNSASITSPDYVEPESPRLLLSESDKIQPLTWILDEALELSLDEAELKMDEMIANFSLVIKEFSHFGRRFVKDQNLSPDAFVQLALQYTFFKLHGQLVSTYESASLRQFRLGRVDNIRANTCEAHRWIQAMLACKQAAQAEGPDRKQAPVDFGKAEQAFIAAVTKQVDILRYTINGSGPDNHLLALRELAKIRYGRAQDEAPELFRDPSYKEFLNFRLSTSQLPNESGITVGYGAVVHDGYGCSYNPRDEQIVFCVSCFANCPATSSEAFAAVLEESLLEMQQMCLGRKAAAAACSVSKICGS